MRRILGRMLAVGLLVLAGLAVAGVASAFWSVGGGGSGSGSSDTTQPVTLTPGVAADGLYPGGEANVTVAISNPNAETVRIESLSLDPTSGAGGFAVDAGHAGCLVDTFGFETQTNAGRGWTVPASDSSGNGSLVLTLPNAVSMDLGAANSCQGATITVYLTAGP
jgi:hypothetical protein